MRRGWTQDALGRRLHVSRQTLNYWEVGKRRPRPQRLSEIADVLGLEVVWSGSELRLREAT